MPSLENCAERRGIPLRKVGIVSELIKGGTCPSVIPLHQLKEYNEVDLELTKQVFESQFAEAKERGMLPLIWSQMKALVATAEMEYNGIHIDTNVLDTYGADLTAQIKDAANMFCFQIGKITGMAHLKGVIEECYAYKIANDILSGKDAVEILSSTKEISFLLFGGKRKETEKKLVGKYKNGKDKYKNTEVEVEYKGLWFPSAHGAEINGNGYYTVDDKVLKSIRVSGGSIPEFSAMIASILEYREASKQLSTYVDGVRKALWPGNVVHTNFNHSVTLTGRLSCSNPNLQNQTDGEIKRAYIPRDTNGLFIEFDYQQLEVIGLAVLSQDVQLLDDLRSGRDVHTELFRDMYGTEPTKEQRKAFKPLTFGLIYGAGANTLAENAGKTVAEARRFVETFYRRYPGVQAMHEILIDRAKREREMTTRKTEHGYPVGMFVLRTQTGREYEFYEYESEYKKGTVSFSPTELKNWQVQGFATGDVVPLVIGEVVEELTASKWYGTILPIVTVHDSIMFELRGNADVTEARNYLEKLLSNTRERIERRFGFDPGIDFHVEGKVGHNWKEMV
jgi:DNA polymerase I-like protein with 3'-5' exonuclease and polymerase domains